MVKAKTTITGDRKHLVLSALIVLIPLVFLLIVRHHYNVYSSDDVAVQVIVNGWLHGIHGITLLPPDNFLIKAPIYALVELTPFAPHIKLLITVLVLNLICFGFFGLAAYQIVRAKSSSMKWEVVATPVLWLATLGGAFAVNLLVPNYRNAELGIVFLALAAACSYVWSGQKWKTPRLVAATIGLSIFWFNDPYFLFLAGVPFVLLAGLWWVFRQRDVRPLYASAVVVASAVMARLWPLVAHWLGVHIGAAPGLTLHLHGLVQHLQLLPPAISALVELDFHASLSHMILAVINAAVLIAEVAASLYLGWLGWRERDFVNFLLGVQWLFVVAGFILSSDTSDLSSARYLVIGLFDLCLASVVVLSRLSHRRLGVMAIAGFLLLASLGNVAVSLKNAHRDTAKVFKTEQSAVLTKLTSLGLNKGYGPYWEAAINTYLMDGHTTVVPAGCTDGRITPWYWFMDTGEIGRTASQSFYIYHDVEAAGCPLSSVESQFGAPVRTINVDQHIEILIFNTDIGHKLGQAKLP